MVAAPRPTFLQALSPPIYLVSVLPGLSVIALGDPPASGVAVIGAATAGVVLLQHAVNLHNDVTDGRRGADEEKRTSWVRFHRSERAARAHGLASATAGVVVGLASLGWAGKTWIAGTAAPFVVLGILYNGGRRPLSYDRYAEWVTALCYGPGVFGSLWLLARPPSVAALFGAAAYGALAAAVLLAHQPPQRHTDARAGKRTYAVRHGPERTRRAAIALFAAALIAHLGATVAAGRSVADIAAQSGVALLVFAGSTGVAGSLDPRLSSTPAPTPARILAGASLCVLQAALGTAAG